MISGKPVPVEKRPGDEVVGATVNGPGSLRVRATKVGSASVLAQIVEMVRRALDGDELLRLVAAPEADSEHPLAQVVVAGAVARGRQPAGAESFESITGQRIRATVERVEVLVGNPRRLQAAGEDLADLSEQAGLLSAEGKTAILVGVDGCAAGVVAVADSAKDDSVAAVGALNALGLEVVMITGDTQSTAEAVARQVGIDRSSPKCARRTKAAEVSASRPRVAGWAWWETALTTRPLGLRPRGPRHRDGHRRGH